MQNLIVKYQSCWETNFEKIKEVIQSELEGLEVRIEHIGSTAVRNLAAKPIIDIDISYHGSVKFYQVKNKLGKLGYNHIGNLGIQGREVFKRENRKYDHQILDNIAHHLYVCPIDSPEFIRHILFRDYLRNNENARMEYEILKLSIAKQANQVHKDYAYIKEILAKEFIESILRKAKENPQSKSPHQSKRL